MCGTCGCGEHHHHHDHTHEHSHGHEHHHHPDEGIVINLEQDILQRNNLLAERNRGYCGDCMHREHKYDRARTLYEYRDVAPSIYRFKYSGRQEYGDFFGEEMARLLGDFIGRVRPDVIVPVPLYRGKLRKRGYNQAACLARALGRSLELPVDEKLVKRVRNTAPMKHLNPTERQNNLKKAFIIGRNDVKLYDRIILVDDIYTTGTTLDEIAALLKEHGVSKVYCVTLACGSGV